MKVCDIYDKTKSAVNDLHLLHVITKIEGYTFDQTNYKQDVKHILYETKY